MTRFEKIKSMSVNELAKTIKEDSDINLALGKRFCYSDCGVDCGCPHNLECVIKWLNEKV